MYIYAKKALRTVASKKTSSLCFLSSWRFLYHSQRYSWRFLYHSRPSSWRFFYIIRDHILAFCFSSFQKHLGTFHEHFFEAFFYYFDNYLTDGSLDIFLCKKKIIWKITAKKWFKTFYRIAAIGSLCSLHNW